MKRFWLRGAFLSCGVRQPIIPVVLSVLLIVSGVLLGFTLVSSGGGEFSPRSTSSGGGSSGGNASPGGGGKAPELVVIARGIGQDFVFSPSLTPDPPAYMYVPLSSLPVSVTPIGDSNPRPMLFYTNVSGMFEFPLAQGQYDVVIKDPSFHMETQVNLSAGKRTVISLRVLPSFADADALVLVNHDDLTTIGPSTELVVHINSTTEYNSGDTVKVVGSPHPGSGLINGSFQTVQVNASTVGEYQGVEGSWLVLQPLGTYSVYPVDAIRVLVYEPHYTVETIAQ